VKNYKLNLITLAILFTTSAVAQESNHNESSEKIIVTQQNNSGTQVIGKPRQMSLSLEGNF